MAGVDPGARALTHSMPAATTYFPPTPSQWHNRPESALFCIQSASSASSEQAGFSTGRIPVGGPRTLEGCVPNLLESRAIATAILKWNVTLEATECAVGCGACC
jgi:hypothetical protein